LAEALTETGNRKWQLGQNQSSLSSFSEAEAIYKDLGDKRKLADLSVVEGRTKQAMAEIDDALKDYEEPI
jgi:hypothetical protein